MICDQLQNSLIALFEEKNPKFHQSSFATESNDFVEITAQGRSFVDKTLFIKDIIETPVIVTMITRPMRWGKTTNLDMLSKFFAVETDETKGRSYKELFQRLLIGQKYPGLVDDHQGQYPVIYFTFKNIKARTYRAIKSELIMEIQKLYNQYSYLYSNSMLRENSRIRLKKYLKGRIDLLDVSLAFLSSLLNKHHNKRVYLFIDDYDAFLNATYDTQGYEKTFRLMRYILSEDLEGNNSLEKAVVTGVTDL